MKTILILRDGTKLAEHHLDRLSDLCLTLTGGGYTNAQTIKAMTLMGQVNRTGSGSVRVDGKKYTLVIVDAEEIIAEAQAAALADVAISKAKHGHPMIKSVKWEQDK
jgi:phage tail sheath gpL-like